MDDNIIYKKINEEDYDFLYNILKLRLNEPETNINLKILPEYQQHVKYLQEFRGEWFIIIYYYKKIGYVYLTTDKEIGIYILEEFRRNGFGRTAINFITKGDKLNNYIININPLNTISLEFFKKLNN